MVVQNAFAFPIGYHDLHPDVSLNFQLNRFWNWVGEAKMLEEMRSVAPRIKSYADWTRELLGLADSALSQGRAIPAAYFTRMAEFFMWADDPRRRPARERFLEIVLREHRIHESARHSIPYGGGRLSAYRFTPDSPRGQLVIFGGFDSYIEEWFPILFALQAEGLDVVSFDGPGQGAALEAGVPMTSEWHKPVGAVLDHFGLTDVSLLGFSLGGCLAIRAAAREPRVRRVIADDVLTDFRAVIKRPLSPAGRWVLGQSRWLPAPIVNAAVGGARRGDLVVDWGVAQGMRVLGVKGPAELFAAIDSLRTDDVSPDVKQDVLLMAGCADHYVPVSQLGDQLLSLTHARSLAARLFTEAEHAQNHCQIGNLGLSLRVIVNWLDAVGGRTST